MEKLIAQQHLLFSEIKSAIKNYNKDPKKRKTMQYFKIRKERAVKLWKTFENCHEKILENVSTQNPSAAEEEYFKQEIFSEAEEIFLVFLAELEENITPESEKLQNKDESFILPSPSENSTVKLPRITLPKFSGDYILWTSFRDLFISLIHNKQSLSKAEKVHYLKASLSGEAERLIQGFAVTEVNYDTAWEILINRYENKRMLVNSQLDILFKQPHCVESSQSVKRLLDTTVECVQALRNLKLNNALETILVYMTTKKLPQETLQLWEQQLASKTDLPAFNTIKDFLESRFRALEAIELSKSKPSKAVNPHKNSSFRQQAQQVFLAERRHDCGICSGDHLPKNCQKFVKLPFHEKNDVIKRLGLCINCLNRGHILSSCPSRFSCNYCGKRHHSLMHIFNPSSNSFTTSQISASAKEFMPSSAPSTDIPLTDSSNNAVQSMHVQAHKEVLLATALVTLEGSNGMKQIFRALIDQGSQASFTTENAVQSLGLRKRSIHAVISGVGQLGIEASKIYTRILPPNNNKPVDFEALVLKNIANHLPSRSLSTDDWYFMNGLRLADPTFNKPGKIDVLLGADVYAGIIQEGLRRGPNNKSIAQNTILGWILCGETFSKPTAVDKVFAANVIVNQLSEQLQQFWKLEEFPQTSCSSPSDDACEKFFVETHRRLEDGTYSVRLPFVSDEHRKSLGASRSAAVASLLHLEKKFAKDPELQEEYTNCLNEYLSLGHAKIVSDDEANHMKSEGGKQFYSCYYMPHHAVFKDSTTTKLRVVFDASRKTTSGMSLNKALLTGPAIQSELIRILLQWRRRKFSFIADIEKMYRQVKVHQEDTNYQRIVWRSCPNKEIKDYCLTTVTFGVTCAPYLAIRVLKQLAEDEKSNYPIGAQALACDFYVDDILSGADTIESAIEKQEDLNKLLQSGGFKLRKWIANDNRVLESVPIKDRVISDNVDLNLDNGVKSLGLMWYPSTDTIGYKVDTNSQREVSTKRELLSEIAKLYDPLGWISPVITTAKILMQAVWLHGSDWDESLPTSIRNHWQEFKHNIHELGKLRINRWLNLSKGVRKIQIHAFSDASQRAYAGVLYLRTIDEEDLVHSTILIAKSKVAPVKPVSIPRLELCGVVIAARLIKFAKDVFSFENVECHLWTDSTIVLAWLNSHPSRWTTFISNRTSEALELLGNTARHHVSTADNPADLASRGRLANELVNNDFWWHGPKWLRNKNFEWPTQPTLPTTDLELRTIKTNLCLKDNYLLEILEKYSSLGKLIRVTVYCRRFIDRSRKLFAKTGWITTAEIEKATSLWIMTIQRTEFSKEVSDLKETRRVNIKSRLANLNPFLDDHGILRVGGRLQNSNLPYNERHPIILPKSGHFIQLLLQRYHLLTLHGGSQLMLTVIRKRFWILDARNAIRFFIHKCIKCYKLRGQTSSQLMSNLPRCRVTQSRPFTNSGVDYCGPIYLRMSKHRGSKTYKGYIAIFVCLAVKAVHIEPVSDMTTTAFLAAFRRFVARRGLCRNIYSDCGTNFVGANALLKEIYKENKRAFQELANEGVMWHFIPPSTPHFGGLWESCVKSAKYHLRRIVGNAILTFEELYTILSQIEACMNSRPLCTLTSDSEDVSALTPGHFLIGDMLLAPAQEDLTDKNINSLDRWRLTQKLLQNFWNRWSREYLHQLQQRTKWKTLQRDIRKNNIVLVKDDRFPPNKWPLGRVLNTHAGNDGLVRVVTVQIQGQLRTMNFDL